MYAIANPDSDLPPVRPLSPVAKEVAHVLEMRDRALASGELLYASPVVRALVEREIPRLVALLAQGR